MIFDHNPFGPCECPICTGQCDLSRSLELASLDDDSPEGNDTQDVGISVERSDAGLAWAFGNFDVGASIIAGGVPTDTIQDSQVSEGDSSSVRPTQATAANDAIELWGRLIEFVTGTDFGYDPVGTFSFSKATSNLDHADNSHPSILSSLTSEWLSSGDPDASEPATAVFEHIANGPCECPNCAGEMNLSRSLEPVRPQEFAPPEDQALLATGKLIFDNNQVISQIDSELYWAASGSGDIATTITYGITTNADWFPDPVRIQGTWYYREGNTWSALNADQAAAAIEAIELWDDLIAPEFVNAADIGLDPNSADIRFSNTTTDIGYAHAYYPGGYTQQGTPVPAVVGTDATTNDKVFGSVWFNPTYTSGTNSLTDPDPSEYGYMAFIHEIGHTIGFSHPGAYNGGSPTYENNAEYAQDTHQYTVMSYFYENNTGASWKISLNNWVYAQTPMVHDILVAQSIYGADPNTRATDTVYGFNSTAGKDVYNFSLNSTPVLSIYDAGGIDTLDLSGFTLESTINLTPGSYTSAGGLSASYPMIYNIGIAYGTWIENAIGGSNADQITGNDLGNMITGGPGNDHLYGGLGPDIFVYDYLWGVDTIYDFEFGLDLLDFTAMADVGYYDLSVVSYSFGWQVGYDGQIIYIETNSQFAPDSDDFLFAFVSGVSGALSAPTVIVPGGVVNLMVDDADLNGDPLALDTVVIDVLNEDTGETEAVTLTETGLDTGLFEGALPTLETPGAGTNDNGTLNVEFGDTLTVTYFDANDGAGGSGPVTSTVSVNAVEANGGHKLIINAAGQYQIDDGAGTVVSVLSASGGNVGPEQWPGWFITQAEAYGSGYAVLWQKDDGTQNTLWLTDANGQRTSFESYAPEELVQLESFFDADLDGDGDIGVVEANGGHKLIINAAGQYQIDDGAGTVVSVLSASGGNVGPEQWPGWFITQAEAYGSGYAVLWQKDDGTQNTLWLTDANGQRTSFESYAPEELVQLESLFSADLDGDGDIDLFS